MTVESKALGIPDGVAGMQPNEVTELARIWWGGMAPHMNIRPALKDPRHMGIVLAEASWHFSNAYAEIAGLDQAEALKEIQEGWAEAHERTGSQRKEPGA